MKELVREKKLNFWREVVAKAKLIHFFMGFVGRRTKRKMFLH